MAKSSTTLKKGDNLPGRGKSKRTLILDAIRKQSLLGLKSDASKDDAEEAFFAHMAERAVNKEDNSSAMLIKVLADKGWASTKPTMEPVEFEFDSEGSAAAQASQIVEAIAKGQLSPDVGNMLINSIANLMKIVEITELEERLKALEESQNESP